MLAPAADAATLEAMSGFAANCWRLWRMGRNSSRRLIIEQPQRGFAILIVLSSIWLLLGGLFWAILHFLNNEQYAAFKEPLLETLLGVFCFALFFLVLISDLVVVWAGLFRSRAALFLAQTPASDRSLFWIASIEGALWSCWAVVVLALPLVGTLALEAVQPLRFILAATGALAGFVGCTVAVGSLGALLLARLIPLLRRGLPGIVALAVVAVLFGAIFVVGDLDRGAPGTIADEVTSRLAFTGNPFLPSGWAREALIAARHGHWAVWLHHFGLLVTTAGTIFIAAEWLAGRRLRHELDALCGRGDGGRRIRSRPWGLLPGLPKDLSLLVVKDLRLFVRDPAQVLQFTMFFGLLGFYLLMLPRLGKAFLLDENWRPVVSVLNLTAIAMALATFTGRFVYPLLSLEGRRLWVLALAPLERPRLVTAKFAFALVVGIPVSVTLVCLSGIMLKLPPDVVGFQALAMTALAMGLSAGALGLGARFADFNEDNPGKLVAGYGGNLNLLASLAFSTLIILGTALPITQKGIWWSWLVGGTWILVITAIWVAWFLRMARRLF